MRAKIITTNQELLTAFKDFLKSSREFSAAVGFISPEGLSLLADELKGGPSARIIVGDLDDFERTRRFVDHFLSDVEVRYCPQSFLHSKVYFFRGSGNQRCAIIGSSNLTYSGLTSNIETNALLIEETVEDEIEFSRLEGILEGLWQVGIEEVFVKPSELEEKAMITLTPDQKATVRMELKRVGFVPSWGISPDKYVEGYHLPEFSESLKPENLQEVFEGELKDFFYNRLRSIGDYQGVFNEHGNVAQQIVDQIFINDLPAIRGTLTDLYLKTREGEIESHSPDELYDIGRGLIGVGDSIATEILCRLRPDKLAWKNQCSEFALWCILGRGDLEFVENMAYSRFIRYVDAVGEVYFDAAKAEGVKISYNAKYLYLNGFFRAVYDYWVEKTRNISGKDVSEKPVEPLPEWKRKLQEFKKRETERWRR